MVRRRGQWRSAYEVHSERSAARSRWFTIPSNWMSAARIARFVRSVPPMPGRAAQGRPHPPRRCHRGQRAKAWRKAWRRHGDRMTRIERNSVQNRGLAARPQHAHHRRRRARRHAKVHHWVAARPPPPPDQAPATAPIFVESLRSRRSGPLLTNINKSRSPSRSKSRSPQAAPLAVEPVEDAKAVPDALRRDPGERRCPPTHCR